MSWFLAVVFFGTAVIVTVEREPVTFPWWLWALMSLVIGAGELREAITKRRG